MIVVRLCVVGEQLVCGCMRLFVVGEPPIYDWCATVCGW